MAQPLAGGAPAPFDFAAATRLREERAKELLAAEEVSHVCLGWCRMPMPINDRTTGSRPSMYTGAQRGRGVDRRCGGRAVLQRRGQHAGAPECGGREQVGGLQWDPYVRARPAPASHRD